MASGLEIVRVYKIKCMEKLAVSCMMTTSNSSGSEKTKENDRRRDARKVRRLIGEEIEIV